MRSFPSKHMYIFRWTGHIFQLLLADLSGMGHFNGSVQGSFIFFVSEFLMYIWVVLAKHITIILDFLILWI